MFFTPTKLRELCKQYGLTPSKRYGQNFLIQKWPIEKMLEAAEVSKKDVIIEIGPGFGALTFALASAAKKVIAFEIERKLEKYWNEKIETEKLRNLKIVWGNALKELKSYKVESYKVVANLPYQITSNVLRTILELGNKSEVIVVMAQKEVAERICARPPDMSLLAVSVQYYGAPEIIAKVSKGNFWPEPKVDSAILKIEVKPRPFPPLIGEGREGSFSDKEFFKIVKAGFANKRKQLWKNLAVGLKLPAEKVKAVILEVAGNQKVRAEELSVENWVKISKQTADSK